MTVGIVVFVFLAACSLQLISARVSRKIETEISTEEDEKTRVVYPGPIQDIENDSDPCEGLTYCTIKPDTYPQEQYNKLMKGKLTDPIFMPTPSIDVNGTMLDDRQGDPDFVNNCPTTVKFEPLYKVRGGSGEWRTVVQAAEENFLQMVRLEICKKNGRPCFTSFKSSNLKAVCKQSYNSWDFLVDDNKGGTERIQVELPVCCSCHYSQN